MMLGDQEADLINALSGRRRTVLARSPDLGAVLRQARGDIPQHQIARSAGIDRSTVSRIETGEGPDHVQTLTALLKAAGATEIVLLK